MFNVFAVCVNAVGSNYTCIPAASSRDSERIYTFVVLEFGKG